MGNVWMRNITEILPTQDCHPMELQHLRIAAYCRVSTDLEEQTSSIELQKRCYNLKISGNPTGRILVSSQKEPRPSRASGLTRGPDLRFSLTIGLLKPPVLIGGFDTQKNLSGY